MTRGEKLQNIKHFIELEGREVHLISPIECSQSKGTHESNEKRTKNSSRNKNQASITAKGTF